MKCQVTNCQNEAHHQIGLHIPDSAAEHFKVPVVAQICDEHYEIVKVDPGPLSYRSARSHPPD
jgi:hypothetical protein